MICAQGLVWLDCPCIMATLLLPQRTRHLPTHLQCEELWHMPLDQRLPGHTAAKVARKCCDMAAFAIKVR